MIAVNLMHILLIGPIMIYINFNRENELFKKILIGFTLMIPFIVNIPKMDKLHIDYHATNLAHWTIILAYFSYVSYLFALNKDIPEYIYISLAIIGGIMILVHLYKLIPKIFRKKNKNNNDNKEDHNHS
tara:strand:- start:6767 stop:7153 length:387 start_codon:yes stop_codon:yes gene_type:complete